MNWLIVAGIAALIVSPLLLKRVIGRGGKLSRRSYQKHAAIFSADDRAFFRPLKDAMGEEFEIFGKIRVCDIILPKKSVAQNGKSSALDPIAGRHFDFVLCDKTTLAVACAIQLHDKTVPALQSEQDPIKPICENLGLPLVRFNVKADYSVEEIREKLVKAMTREPFYWMETDGRKEPRISSIEDIKF
jgi:hypothetical protein